jgi:heptosyltransferase I
MSNPVPRVNLSGKRIAIVMMSAIGDAVHVLPVLNSIRAQAPDAHITWIIQPGPHALVANHPAVDEFIIFDRKAGWRGFRDIYRATRGKRFDLVIALQVYFKAGVIAAMLKSPHKLGFDRARARDMNWLFTTDQVPPHPYQHVQNQYFEFLDHLGIPRRLEWKLGSTQGERAHYSSLLPPTERPTVALVLATSKPQKDWPAERYTELVDRLGGELGARTVLVGAPSERERAAADVIRERAVHPPLDLLAWDLRRLVYLIERADVVVSPDTGPMHISVAVGTPVVAMVGHTNPMYGGPYHRFHDLLIDAFREPGEVNPPVFGRRPDRMQRISVDEVFNKVKLALERYPKSGSGQAEP